MRGTAGVRLLQKMGWRQGRGIGTATSVDAEEEGSRWGRVAGVGVDNVPIYRLAPKTDVHGLGFDPYEVRLPSNPVAFCPHPAHLFLSITVHGGIRLLHHVGHDADVVHFLPGVPPSVLVP